MPPTKAESNDGDESLKRLGGGRWQTRDDRFTIEPQSGTWAVVDAEETDDLGLPLVRGPFRGLTDAKAAIAGARTTGPPPPPPAPRIERGTPAKGRRDDDRSAEQEHEEAPSKGPKQRKASDEPEEPRWL